MHLINSCDMAPLFSKLFGGLEPYPPLASNWPGWRLGVLDIYDTCREGIHTWVSICHGFSLLAFLTKLNKFLEFFLKTATLSPCRYLRAVAYRWLIRWLCGYMGWDNTRPLPACIYHNVRTKFDSHQAVGYATALERDWVYVCSWPCTLGTTK